MDPELYSQVKINIKKLLNIDLTYYKDEQMKRRLDSWLVRAGLPSWDLYFSKIKSDDDELIKFRNYLTINVTEFFRDIERWNFLRDQIIPDLLSSLSQDRIPRKSLKVWSAGCSVGVEAYSLAILLNESFHQSEAAILATDLDRGALQKAMKRGPYSVDETKNLTNHQRSTYFEPGGPPYFVNSKIASKIKFMEQNLLQDAFDTGFDLIVCRNVVIYFTQEAKDILYHKFNNALRPGGVLFLGGTEIIPKPQEFGFRNRGISFYIKG